MYGDEPPLVSAKVGRSVVSQPLSDSTQLAAALQATMFFQGLDEQVLCQFAEGAHWRAYEAGAVIFLEGDMAPGFYYVQQGWVKIVKMSPEGREQILYFCGPGDLFGGMSVFANQPMPATAITLEPTGLWLLPRNVIQQHLAAEPTMALRVIEFMARRINELIALVTDLSLRSVTARLARLLLDEAEADLVQRQRWATQSELAARLGAAPDVLNRALRTLVEEGLIDLSRQQIRLLDRQGLAAKAIPDR